MRVFKLFVSSPDDTKVERLIIEQVVSKLNGAFAGTARLETIRWETEFYVAHKTFQAQIPEAADCDIVISILKGKLGTPLPATFGLLPGGERYPSGTAYEVLTAIEAAKQRAVPDVYIFRQSSAPAPALDDPNRGEIEAEWQRLGGFVERWVVSKAEGFKASFHTYQRADDFSKNIERLLREWLGKQILAGRSLQWPVEILGSPFRGLESFGAKHQSVFFGRERESEKAVALLTDAARRGVGYLLVSGLSGAGKSSLARAGIVPRLTTPGVVPQVQVWRVASFRPGGNPFMTLATKLFEDTDGIPADEQGRAPALPELKKGDYKTPADLVALLRQASPSAIQPVLAALDRVAQAYRKEHGFAGTPEARLVVMIDQLDDLFAASISDEERQAFAMLLDAFARSGRVLVIATLRADLTASYLGVEALRLLREEGAEIAVAPPGPAELAEIVRKPADAAGLHFEEINGERLDERLLREADKADMLPLLQLALGKVFAERVQRGEELVLTHRALGSGLASLIADEAKAALAVAGPGAHALLPRLLRQLVEHGKDDKSILRTVPFATAGGDEASAALVKALIDRRIMLSDRDGVRLSHQRVLSDWPAAAEAHKANKDFYRIRDEVEAAHRIYMTEGARRDRLLGAGKPVSDALWLLKGFDQELPAQTKAYIAASRDKARLGARIRNAAVLIFAGVAVFVVWQWREVGRQKDVAIAQTIIAQDQTKEAERQKDIANNHAVEARRQEASAIVERDRAEAATLRSRDLAEVGNLFTRQDSAQDRKILSETERKRALYTSMLSAALRGNHQAGATIGYLFEEGIGVEQDIAKAREWYEKAAAAGNLTGMNNLGLLYRYGKGGIAIDASKARELFEKAAEAGNSAAMINFGDVFADGIGVEQNSIKALNWYEKSAELNDPLAMHRIGYLYDLGRGIQQDYAKAREWYEKAAAAGDGWAMNNLGVLYRDAEGVAQDYVKAREWFERAVAVGNHWAMRNLGALYRDAQGVEQNYAKARDWFEKAAAVGNSNAMVNLGHLYANGLGVAKDLAKAREWYVKARELYEKAAAAGDSDAMNEMGRLYHNANGVERDYVKAREWYEKAAAAGNRWAMNNLGVLYRDAQGDERDYVKAREWFEKAAAAGNSDAMNNIGLLYYNANGVERDYVKAREWYEKAAAAGNSTAMNNLGRLYHDAQGVERDYAKAREWFEKAAAAGNSDAMNDIGRLYHNANGVERDYVKARAWYEKAAAAGNSDAMNNIGLLYHNANGVERDYVKARAWYEKAAAAGNRWAMNNLGWLYRVAQDYAKAREWYEKAAAAGNSTAMINLAVLYENSLGVPQDFAKAREWMEKAAALGNSDAMINLGNFYRRGFVSGTPDYTKAREWYEKAAAAGQGPAMVHLGSLYYDGRGVTQDFAKAREWYEKAAAAGEGLAMSVLGEMYHKGHGVKRDYVKAREWYEKGADKGFGRAMYGLGVLYRDGDGVKQDYTKAREWFETAALTGSANAMNDLGVIYLEGQGVGRDYEKAREWFQEAADEGHLDAMYRLGRLYEAGLGGPRDIKKAVEWYQAAVNAGYGEAAADLARLKRRK